ncbi:MAG: hypothetical protein ISR76_05475 [Planctomycetes bacterium]|nr:hypothetical protein [Planctomycetota bacterium]
MSAGRGEALATPLGRLFLAAVCLSLVASWAAGAWAAYGALAGADGRPGLSLRDVEVRYHGDRRRSRFSVMLNGPMLAHLADPGDAARLTAWARQPAAPAFDPAAHERRYEGWVQPLLARDCLGCHSPGGAAGLAPLRSYDELRPLLEADRGPSWQGLARRSHRRLAVLGLLALASGALAFSFLPPRPAGILSCLAACGLLLQVGGWWATKLVAAAAPLVPFGGLCYGAGFVLVQFGLLRRCLRPHLLP